MGKYLYASVIFKNAVGTWLSQGHGLESLYRKEAGGLHVTQLTEG